MSDILIMNHHSPWIKNQVSLMAPDPMMLHLESWLLVITARLGVLREEITARCELSSCYTPTRTTFQLKVDGWLVDAMFVSRTVESIVMRYPESHEVVRVFEWTWPTQALDKKRFVIDYSWSGRTTQWRPS